MDLIGLPVLTNHCVDDFAELDQGAADNWVANIANSAIAGSLWVREMIEQPPLQFIAAQVTSGVQGAGVGVVGSLIGQAPFQVWQQLVDRAQRKVGIWATAKAGLW